MRVLPCRNPSSSFRWFLFALVFFFKVKSFDIAEGNPFIGQLFFYGIYVCQIIVSVGSQYSRNFSGCNGKNIFFVIGYFSSFFFVIVAGRRRRILQRNKLVFRFFSLHIALICSSVFAFSVVFRSSRIRRSFRWTFLPCKVTKKCHGRSRWAVFFVLWFSACNGACFAADLYYFDLMCGKHVSMIRLGSDKS